MFLQAKCLIFNKDNDKKWDNKNTSVFLPEFGLRKETSLLNILNIYENLEMKFLCVVHILVYTAHYIIVKIQERNTREIN